jgi:hypothetical protein
MLQLSIRTNRLLSIHIRSVSLEFERYLLQIVTVDGNNFISQETESTMVKMKLFTIY